MRPTRVALLTVFGHTNVATLPAEHRSALEADLRLMMQDEPEDCPDAVSAAVVLRNRIGGIDQLAGYARCIVREYRAGKLGPSADED